MIGKSSDGASFKLSGTLPSYDTYTYHIHKSLEIIGAVWNGSRGGDWERSVNGPGEGSA